MADETPTVADAPTERNGVSDQGDGNFIFALWAPWKKSVHLVGDFNNWDKEVDALAVSDSGLWWVSKKLESGTYGYQFVIDGETYVCDPYAQNIRWAEGSSQPHAVLEVGAQQYEWNDDGFAIKPLNQLVIYEIHVGDFSEQGTFQGVIDKLDYLTDLGVDAIELMPVQEFPGDQSWGYNSAYFFCVESAYGTVDDFKRLVDSAHQRGIGIILDMVFNHTTEDAPINLLYPYDKNPYLGRDGNPWGFPDLNHWNDATKRLTRDIQDYWLNSFHIDGFRYDYVEGIQYDGESGMSFLAWSARQSKPYAYLIAEDIRADPSAVVRDTEADCSWHWQFTKVLRAQLREGPYEGNQYGDLDAVARVIRFDGDGYGDNAQPINYLESHDEDRLVPVVRSNPHIDEGGAIRKSMLGAIMLFTAQGVPMLYHGQEFGAQNEKTIEVNKIPWNYLDGDNGKALHAFYRTLAYLRHTNEALHTNYFDVMLSDHDQRVLVYHRWADNGNDVVVAVNLSPADQNVEITFPRAGRWHEWLHDYDEHVGDGPTSIDLPDSFGKIWVFQE